MPAARDITLRRSRPSDAAAAARLMADAEVFGNLMQLPWPTEEVWRKRFEAAPEPDSGELLLLAERQGELLGSLGLHPVNRLRRRHAAMLGISVGKAHQGQGVGSLLMAAACDFADRWAQILRIELTVFTDNTAAMALYRKFGFRLEGTHSAYALRDGRYVDVHAMARLHPNPPRAAWPDEHPAA
jgi:L-phenylalanine/L-methionine N-acetyltransferase